MSVSDKLPDAGLVDAIADLVHPESKVHPIYRQQVLVVGDDVYPYADPLLPAPTALQVSTLQAVVDFVACELAQDDLVAAALQQCVEMPVQMADGTPADVERGVLTGRLVVQVVGPAEVRVVSPVVGDQRQQFTYLVARPDLPGMVIGKPLELLPFIIQLQTVFAASLERDALLEYVGGLSTGRTLKIEDDGVSQQVTKQDGVQRISPAQTVRRNWDLAPFRTFHEVEQPGSTYLLRVDGKQMEGYVVPSAALYEADGGAWRVTAIGAVAAWLRSHLPAGTVVLG